MTVTTYSSNVEQLSIYVYCFNIVQTAESSTSRGKVSKLSLKYRKMKKGNKEDI